MPQNCSAHHDKDNFIERRSQLAVLGVLEVFAKERYKQWNE
jgi:hypothetical protein